MVGLFYEHGPYQILNKEGEITIERRDISWNEDLYILYVDQPRGVGFSKLIGNPCYSEECVADDIYIFLTKFFDLHPEFHQKPFFVAGQSYAGHYIPAIARKLLIMGNPKINLQGVAIGNPQTDPPTQFGAFAYFLYTKGITTLPEYIGDRTMELLCQLLIKLGVDHRTICRYSIYAPPELYGFYKYDIRLKPGEEYDFSPLGRYLNNEAIKHSLGIYDKRKFHVENSIVKKDILEGGHSERHNVGILLQEGIKVLIYSGMEDYMCNYMGSETWMRMLDWPGNNGWKLAQEEVRNSSNTVIAYYKKYLNLSFLKVINAGHFVPMNQPFIAFNMIMHFIYN